MTTLNDELKTFPCVLIFAKWEKFKQQWRHKDFVRREVKGPAIPGLGERLL